MQQEFPNSFPSLFPYSRLFFKTPPKHSLKFPIFFEIFIYKFLVFLKNPISVQPLSFSFFFFFNYILKLSFLQTPAMAEHGLVSDDELLELSFSYSLESIENTYNTNDTNTHFVFSIEPSLLIDPRSIKIGRVIGEGSNSTVYEGLWVPLSLKKKKKKLFFTCFVFFLSSCFCFMVRLLTFSACACLSF